MNFKNDSDILKLISDILINYNKDLKSYNLSNKNDTNMWDVFDDTFNEVIKNIDYWKNFRKNGLSCGLETGLLQTDRKFYLNNKKEYPEYNDKEVKQLTKRYEELKNMINNDELCTKYLCSNIGNPRMYKLSENVNLNVDDIYNLYSFWQITRYIELLNFPVKTILEIGGGYGNLSCKLLKWGKNKNINLKMILIDLPETIIIQHYYIKMNNPELKIQKINSVEENVDLSCDVIFVPCSYTQVLKNSKIDLFINMRSFGEMNKDIIENYFNLINSNIRDNGLFYTVNRYVTSRGKDTIKFKDYPFGDNWNTIISQPMWLQTHGHEMLIQKNKKPLIPFSKILQSLPNKSPLPGPYTYDYDLEKWAKNNNIIF